jgi:hypothetical protein
MLSLTTLVASSVLATAPVSASLPKPPETAPVTIATNIAQPATMGEPSAEQPKEKRYTCKGCDNNELTALNFFQDKGITDKNALATILGNIKQESTFVPNICEGGARTTYERCKAGGFGLIQFTSSDRYYGLGNFAKRIGGDPSSLDTQLNYILVEPQWLRIQDKMRVPGKPIERYMAYAHSWLGWGIHGARTSYAYDYARRLIPLESDS